MKTPLLLIEWVLKLCKKIVEKGWWLVATKKVTKKKHCSCCGEEKSLSDFYMSKSPLHALDGKTPICKDCVIKSSIDPNTNEIDEDRFKNILRQIDKPFYKDNLQSAINQF